MKSTRYSSYQPLLKALAQAAIADRPEGWTDGELCLAQDGATPVCRLRRSEGAVEQNAPARVVSAAQAFAQALARDGLPWVSCRIGFFRKAVGWGVRVRITPSHGSPELDLTPDRAPPPAESAASPSVPPSSPLPAAPPTALTSRSSQPGLADALALQPQGPASSGWSSPTWPLPEEARPPTPPPAPSDLARVAQRRLCPRCRENTLRFMLRHDGTDHYQCERCGDKLTMVAPDFGELEYKVKAQAEERGGVQTGQLQLQPDGSVTGPDFSIHLSSPETLMYQSGNMQVPVRVVQDVARSLRVLEAERLSTVDTPFGARMLTPREHDSILQNLRQAVHLLPGRYLVE